MKTQRNSILLENWKNMRTGRCFSFDCVNKIHEYSVVFQESRRGKFNQNQKTKFHKNLLGKNCDIFQLLFKYLHKNEIININDNIFLDWRAFGYNDGIE